MGALTLKSFPFELRGWDLEKFESIDPTDGFGFNTRIYINKNEIVLIEPDYNIHSFNTWLTNKGRQFFDSIFKTWNKQNQNFLNKNTWNNLLKTIIQIWYLINHSNKKKNQKFHFNIIFENLSIESLSLLLLINKNYSFINLKRIESIKTNNDLEANFQLNLISNKTHLSKSTTCLLISNNPRYEGFYLNLNLRQRFLKGNFKCLIIGSLINLTFPVSYIGSNLNILKTISEGNNLSCQNLKLAKNPMLVVNSELFKRNDGKNLLKMIKILKHAKVFTSSWNGLNILTPTLTEVGLNNVSNFLPVSFKDLKNSNIIYFLNINLNNIANLKTIIEYKLLNYSIQYLNKLFINQTSTTLTNLSFFNKIQKLNSKNLRTYLNISTSIFYENEETFVNTEGFIKRTIKLISKKKNKNNWQILRKLFKQIKNKIICLNNKDNQIISFNAKKTINFKNFNYFQYFATQSLTNLSFYLSIKSESFILYKKTTKFKSKINKLTNIKMKYWLDDFFNGGKDEYSQNSLILNKCSMILRSESTNFF